jgi:4-hydroxybenzoate polyprenyltransferase
MSASAAQRPWRSTALRVIHPLPCAINALLVTALAMVAGAPGSVAVVLGSAMLAFQASIGAVNDVSDADRDRIAKPWKPIPAGRVSARTATLLAVVSGCLGLVISAAFGPMVLILGGVGLACGLAYDIVLGQRGLGWICYMVAFPTLLAWTWLAAAGELPPGWPLLLPLAALAGPAIHLANSLVDVETDARVGATSLATRLGRRRALVALTWLTTLVWVLAWAVLLSLGSVPREAGFAAVGASLMAGVGLAASWQRSGAIRQAGWLLQAVALAILALAWVVAAT